MNEPTISLLTRFKRDEIAELFKNASVLFRSPHFLLLSAPAKQEYGRLLPVISKKIGSAPKRNQLRRRLKAIFYENRLFALQQDVVFIAKQKEATNLSFDDLRAILNREIKKVHREYA
jgi:ribonuclease P protein component